MLTITRVIYIRPIAHPIVQLLKGPPEVQFFPLYQNDQRIPDKEYTKLYNEIKQKVNDFGSRTFEVRSPPTNLLDVDFTKFDLSQPNSHLRLNQNFIYVQLDDKARVYSENESPQWVVDQMKGSMILRVAADEFPLKRD